MSKQPPVVDIVIFGGHGDLALRKIMPALYFLFSQKYIGVESRIISTVRHPFSQTEHRNLVHQKLHEYLPPGHCSEAYWQSFSARLTCISMDITDAGSYTELAGLLQKFPERARIYYLSTPSSLFGNICTALEQTGLVTPDSRVVLEKPIGHDMASFRQIDDLVTAVFHESQIFRIDHYLGKDTVQNILALRFSNAIFKPLWNSQNIDHVQITVAETVGVEGRWGYYERYGAMRDMVQNHLMQLLCLIAMEPPGHLDSDSVRNEKVKVLKALRKMDKREIAEKTVRGQYRKGASNGLPVPGYLEDDTEPHVSDTETFVAIRADIDNWTWSGVPFYLRTGKRMSERFSEIIIQFKKIPHSVFPDNGKPVEPNKLVIHLQPEESIKLLLMNKKPGLTNGMSLRPVELELNVAEDDPRSPTAYERLLLDVINNDPTLFMRRDEVEAAWEWADYILNHWEEDSIRVKGYTAGTDGPSAAVALIERDGRSWHEHG
ncbi:MAG TPA: glucose-6-phosphate dehydrogenase [Candidatus Thiothrix moscowensis]|uniref:glucose-6-phosphate dehydrogenase n=1 Tax=unclassified Thiothrix TaxID=2636184 RepID=UPI0025EAD9D9|nr:MULTISPECIES: glucose-6-phosphate dehydrogenase [unclassified Thiothrix]HRJ53645.1 glucose-6-phosphate dehydrogenase [Candidatus Thiothrix moscowensis]HRJ93727.1 glucose-6-phosphate dehydrogenase [Candidatus Thiothrix moscowensis]